MKYRYPFQFFFLLGLLLLKRSTIIHHVNQRPDAEHKLPSRMFCSEGFYLVGTLSATFSLLYQLHEFMFYIFRTLMWNILVFFFNSQHPPIKKSNTRPPKNSFCPIYHSLLTSCVVLIDLIYTHYLISFVATKPTFRQYIIFVLHLQASCRIVFFG